MLHDASVLGMGIDTFMILLGAGLLLALAFHCRGKRWDVRTKALSAAEAYVKFIRDTMVYPGFGGAEEGRRFVPFFASLFLFIFTLNFLGLVPGLSAVTSNLSVTVALALVFAIGSLVFSLVLKGPKHTIMAFIPPGLPLALRPFLFLMEAISHVARAFALSVRLFANMLAGHIVIFWILGLVVMLGLAAFPAVLLASGLYAFEIFICFLQAFLFTLLSSMFMGQIIHPKH